MIRWLKRYVAREARVLPIQISATERSESLVALVEGFRDHVVSKLSKIPGIVVVATAGWAMTLCADADRSRSRLSATNCSAGSPSSSRQGTHSRCNWWRSGDTWFQG